MDAEPLNLINRWQKIGYKLESIVETPGSISRRGGILDIYPPTGELPARLEFFGNTIDSIRLFDPISQRSLKTVPEIDIGPVTEMLAIPFGDKIKLDRIIKKIDCKDCNDSAKQQFQQESQRPQSHLTKHPLQPRQLAPEYCLGLLLPPVRHLKQHRQQFPSQPRSRWLEPWQ